MKKQDILAEVFPDDIANLWKKITNVDGVSAIIYIFICLRVLISTYTQPEKKWWIRKICVAYIFPIQTVH